MTAPLVPDTEISVCKLKYTINQSEGINFHSKDSQNYRVLRGIQLAIGVLQTTIITLIIQIPPKIIKILGV